MQPCTGVMTILHTLAGVGLFVGICAAIALILAVTLAGLARLEP